MCCGVFFSGVCVWPGGRDCRTVRSLLLCMRGGANVRSNLLNYNSKQVCWHILVSKPWCKQLKVTHKAIILVVIRKKSIQDNNVTHKHNISRKNLKDNYTKDCFGWYHQLSVLLLTLKKKSKNKSAFFYLRCGSSRNEQSGSTHSRVPSKIITCLPPAFKSTLLGGKEEPTSFMILLKGHWGFALLLLGCFGGRRHFFFSDQWDFHALLPVLKTLDHRINEIVAF